MKQSLFVLKQILIFVFSASSLVTMELDKPQQKTIMRKLIDDHGVTTAEARKVLDSLVALVKVDKKMLATTDTSTIARRLAKLGTLASAKKMDLDRTDPKKFLLRHALYALLSQKVIVDRLDMDRVEFEWLAALVQANRFAVEIEFFRVPISSDHFALIAELHQLHTLKAKEAGLTDAAVKSLENHPNITHLDFDKNVLTHEVIASLLLLPKLRHLILRKNVIGDEGAVALAPCATLRTLDIRNCKVGNKGARALSSSLLRELLMGHNDVTSEGAQEFLSNTRLQHLDLLGCSNISEALQARIQSHISGTLFSTRSKDYIFILSIDGGGTRGIIPAIILHHLKKRFYEIVAHAGAKQMGTQGEEQPNLQLNFAKTFHLVVATSTGSLIGTGLLAPGGQKGAPEHSPETMIKLYAEEAKSVFPQSGKPRPLFSYKYDTSPFEKMLYTYFGDKKLSDLLSRLMVTTVNLTTLKTYIFDSEKAIADPSDNFTLCAVNRAATAAPTYFPAGILLKDDETMRCIDGGLVTNNHSLLGLFEAMKSYPKAKRYFIISLGCGATDKEGKYDHLAEGGLLNWAGPVSSVIRGSATQYVDYLMKLQEQLDRRVIYKRIQPTLKSTILDDASPENMADLAQQGEQAVEDFHDTLEEIIEALTEPYIAKRGPVKKS